MSTYLMLLPLLVLSLALFIKPSSTIFLSIDCRGSNSFVDTNSINWIGDANYVHNGMSQVVDSYYTACNDLKKSASHIYAITQKKLVDFGDMGPGCYTAGTVMSTLRVFPTLKKNCYTINNLSNGEKVLMRASFFYGNYDGKHMAPTFDLLLDGNLWGKANLSIYSEDMILYREYIYDVNGNSTTLCLAQTLPDQIPLISALELRSLGSKMYCHAGSNHVLSTKARFALGAPKDVR